ncbi:MAG: transaldolase [Phycisphaerae bacterium]|nr:MAG: transaldolase [Phycisphaerae bacterium]
MHAMFQKLSECGQSIWYDNVRRDMIHDGSMKALFDEGILGVTSNPTIFEKAVTGSNDYDEQIRELIGQNQDAWNIYDTITRTDIAATADLLRPVYDKTDGVDGYVSIEVNPKLANDMPGTLAEARRLFQTLNRPNIMIKIPGTAEGIPAIEECIATGININVTLIFSADVYEDIMQAYIRGLQRYADAGNDPSRVASVASFFVSRVDSAIDPMLADLPDGKSLQGKAAIANSKIAYQRYLDVFEGEAFAALKAKGARVQRPLWASTSTKNPEYSPTLYVHTLVGANTVNTAPPATINAIKVGFDVATTVTDGIEEAKSDLAKLERMGISLAKVTEDLKEAGVKSFAASFEQLLKAIESKRTEMAS